MAMRFNPPPGWPEPPEGFMPGPGWQPDPSWPRAPAHWQFWVPDSVQPRSAEIGYGPERTPRLPSYPRQEAPGTWQPAPRQQPGTSGMAIAAFVLGLVSASVLAIIFGIVALRRIRRTHQAGKGMAIAGIALGSAWLVLVGGLVVASVLSGSPLAAPGVASSLGPGASSQSVDPFTLTPGDCFDNPTPTPGQAQQLTSVVQTPCTQPHNAQIFASFKVSGSLLSYPGDAKMRSLAASGCNARVTASLDSAKITNSMTIRLLFPLEGSWVDGQRTISCIIFNPTPTLTSSLLKS